MTFFKSEEDMYLHHTENDLLSSHYRHSVINNTEFVRTYSDTYHLAQLEIVSAV